MKTFLSKTIFYFLAGLLLLVWTGSAVAQEHYSIINGYSTLPFGTAGTRFKLGGTGVGFVENDFVVSYTTSTGTLHIGDVRARSSAYLGITGGYLSYSIVVPNDPSAGGSGGTVDNYIRDIFHIEPSDNYPEGTTAPIRFISTLDGIIELFGRPSGGCYVGFTVTYTYFNESGYTIKKFEYALPSEYQYPPVLTAIHEEWDEIDQVQVGTTIKMDVNFSMDMNGSGHDTGAEVTNYLNFFDSLKFGVIADAEGIEMWSDAAVDDDIDNDGISNELDNFPHDPILPGDVNNDGEIDLADSIITMKVLLNIVSDPTFNQADINGDGLIGHEEVINALQVTSEIRP